MISFFIGIRLLCCQEKSLKKKNLLQLSIPQCRWRHELFQGKGKLSRLCCFITTDMSQSPSRPGSPCSRAPGHSPHTPTDTAGGSKLPGCYFSHLADENKSRWCRKRSFPEILYLSPQDGRILCNITTLCQSQNLCPELRGSAAVKVHWNDSLCMNFSPAGPNIYVCYCCCFRAVLTGVDISLKYREEAQILVIISLLSLFGIPLYAARFLSHCDINTVKNL